MDSHRSCYSSASAGPVLLRVSSSAAQRSSDSRLSPAAAASAALVEDSDYDNVVAVGPPAVVRKSRRAARAAYVRAGADDVELMQQYAATTDTKAAMHDFNHSNADSSLSKLFDSAAAFPVLPYRAYDSLVMHQQQQPKNTNNNIPSSANNGLKTASSTAAIGSFTANFLASRLDATATSLSSSLTASTTSSDSTTTIAADDEQPQQQQQQEVIIRRSAASRNKHNYNGAAARRVAANNCGPCSRRLASLNEKTVDIVVDDSLSTSSLLPGDQYRARLSLNSTGSSSGGGDCAACGGGSSSVASSLKTVSTLSSSGVETNVDSVYSSYSEESSSMSPRRLSGNGLGGLTSNGGSSRPVSTSSGHSSASSCTSDPWGSSTGGQSFDPSAVGIAAAAAGTPENASWLFSFNSSLGLNRLIENNSNRSACSIADDEKTLSMEQADNTTIDAVDVATSSSSAVVSTAGVNNHNDDVRRSRQLFLDGDSLSYLAKQRLLGDGKASYLDRLVIELVDTERQYVNDLHDVVQGYQKFLEQRKSDLEMSDELISSLFSNVEQVFLWNKSFYLSLDLCCLDPVRVSRCFSEHLDGFNVYSLYCTSYPQVLSALEEAMRRPNIAQALKDQQSSLNHGLELSAYLLTPLQRFLKYPLLLRKMAEFDEFRCQPISDAYASMKQLADEVNTAMRKHQNKQRYPLLRTLLDQTDEFDNYGELVLESELSYCPPGTSRDRRQVMLFERALLVAKQRSDKTLSLKDRIWCDDLMIVENVSTSFPLAFQLRSFLNSRYQQHTFLAANCEQKCEWCREVKRMMVENSTVPLPEHARSLIMKIESSPAHAADDLGFTARPGRRGNNNNGGGSSVLSPRYLEKRRKSSALDAAKTEKGKKPKKYLRSSSSCDVNHLMESSTMKRKQRGKKLENFFNGRRSSLDGRMCQQQQQQPPNSKHNNKNKCKLNESSVFCEEDAEVIRQMSRSLDATEMQRVQKMSSSSTPQKCGTHQRRNSIDNHSQNYDSYNSVGGAIGKVPKLNLRRCESFRDDDGDVAGSSNRTLMLSKGNNTDESSLLDLSMSTASRSRDEVTVTDYYERHGCPSSSRSAAVVHRPSRRSAAPATAVAVSNSSCSLPAAAPAVKNECSPTAVYQSVWDEIRDYCTGYNSSNNKPTMYSARFPVANRPPLEALQCTCQGDNNSWSSAAATAVDKNRSKMVRDAVERLSELLSSVKKYDDVVIDENVKVGRKSFELVETLQPRRPLRHSQQQQKMSAAAAHVPPLSTTSRIIKNNVDHQQSMEECYERMFERSLPDVESSLDSSSTIFSDEEFDWLLGGVRAAASNCQSATSSTNEQPRLCLSSLDANTGKVIRALVRQIEQWQRDQSLTMTSSSGSEPNTAAVVLEELKELPVAVVSQRKQDLLDRLTEKMAASQKTLKQPPPSLSAGSGAFVVDKQRLESHCRQLLNDLDIRERCYDNEEGVEEQQFGGGCYVGRRMNNGYVKAAIRKWEEHPV